MKKFYESPIVEITVFDVEDVITTSAGGTVETLEWDAETVGQFNTSSEYAGAVGANAVGHYNAYTW